MLNPFNQSPIYLVDTVDTTMRKAKELYAETKTGGLVLTARHQVSGRGRIEKRQWVDSPGESLLFTIILDSSQISFPAEQLPLRAGIAVSHAVEISTGIKSMIKWPNDILIGNRKVCGLLCESTFKSYAIGIGINVNQKIFAGVPTNSSLREPTSLRLEGGLFADPLELLPQILESLNWSFYLKTWKDYIEQRLYRLGEAISIVTGEATEDGRVSSTGNVVTGILRGLDDYGGLIIEDDKKTTVWYSGEYQTGL